ncbi:hypothetical protein HanXRQr2_Chr09g0417581 [Helianthus annuus]|uniref:Uncharacterized protein n=1 Tax=Helianthus annuus TaxID=4232 RepID=A0A9K3IC57_HELAN|nr:hypothetical protein HanXRQr2_Chr09g0417581 [Helianthus annuus]
MFSDIAGPRVTVCLGYFRSKPTSPALCAGAPACFCRSSFISCHYFFF